MVTTETTAIKTRETMEILDFRHFETDKTIMPFIKTMTLDDHVIILKYYKPLYTHHILT